MDFQVYDIAIIPLIVGVVAVFTTLGLPKKLAPVVSVILGILAGIFYLSPEDISKGVLVGLTLGLSSVGLYSGTKNTVQLTLKDDKSKEQ